MYCDCCPTRQMDSFCPYLNRTLCSLGRYQNLEIRYPHFSTRTHPPGVSASDLAYALLCATALILLLDLFLKKRFKRGITGKYHITLAETFFLTGSPSTSPGSFCMILYRFASQTGVRITGVSDPRGGGGE